MSSLLIRQTEPPALGLGGLDSRLDPSGAKFRPPAARNARWFPRPDLMCRLVQEQGCPLILLVAPAGYGKTALLTQWERKSERPFVWLTLDEADRSTARLGASIEQATAVAEVETALGENFVLVLDDVHLLSAPLLKAAVTEILGRLPQASQLVVSCRNEPDLALGRMRTQHEVAVINATDLAMSDVEATSLLRNAGVHDSGEHRDAIIRRCEGWPAALELAAGVSVQHSRSRDAPVPLAGDDRVMSEYFRAEFMDQLSRATARFLMQSSVLDSLSGSLCDEVLDRKGSAALLAGLARGNLPLCPTDSGGSYRLHGLFREMLLSRLNATEPATAQELHRRAAAWYQRTGNLDLALDHASSAGDVEITAELLWTQLPHYLGHGHCDLVQRWLSRFTPEQKAASAGLALATAHSNLAQGCIVIAEDWARTAGVRLSELPVDATGPQQAAVQIVHAWAARSGVRGMGEVAARCSDLLPDDSPWQATCCLLGGTAALLSGDSPRAEALLQDGSARGAVLAPDAAALCLAQLAVLATDHEVESDLARRARAVVGEHGLTDAPSSALVFAISAAAMMRDGLVDQANADVARCLVLLERLGDSPAWLGAETRILLARASLGLGDVPGARELLADASRLARRVQDVNVFHGWFDDAWDQFDERAENVLAGMASLTTAELRVLRFLPTHYSFQEIAQRLHVSANTVKTHVHAVYRKLDASSRSEAVAHATSAGLLARLKLP